MITAVQRAQILYWTHFLTHTSNLMFSSIGASGTLLVYITLSTDYLITNYYLNQIVDNFVLRKMFYSRWGLVDTHCFSACTDYKRVLQYRAFTQKIQVYLLQTLFSLYLHNQWTDFHKLSCAGKLQMRAICTKATTNNWDIRPLVAVKALSANIS